MTSGASRARTMTLSRCCNTQATQSCYPWPIPQRLTSPDPNFGWTVMKVKVMIIKRVDVKSNQNVWAQIVPIVEDCMKQTLYTNNKF
eukprot:m.66121 g.66121  ORF g.66121 m.66121 type:complete len:87 (+) comp23649_c1_seq1:796-1056(+)